MADSALSLAWEQALEALSSTGINAANLGFLKQIRPLGRIEDTILLTAPNAFTKSLVEDRLIDQITNSLSTALNQTVRIALTVSPSETNPQHEAPTETTAPQNSQLFPQTVDNSVDKLGLDSLIPEVRKVSTQETIVQSHIYRGGTAPRPQTQPARHARLNPKYTFDNFVIGSSNRFAHAAAEAIAEAPARAYNPVFIYGGPGLGKTHLLHAVGNYSLQLYPHLHVHYVNSEEFTNDFINSIRSDRTEDFQRRYRAVDILLIDDIQFIQGKEQTMEEFFHTFNALHNANKQIVVTSDLPPKSLPGLEDRLRSRFEWGLITDVQPPDLETRIAILQMKAAAENLEVPQDVLTYIAQRISSNIRELEGSLLRVTAFANLTKQPIDSGVAEMVLKDILSDPEETIINPTLILGQTAGYFDLTIDQLTSSNRSRKVVEARQIAMYLCRELTDLSLPKIGEVFGGRDHSTVMHANKKIQQQMTQRRETYNYVTELTSRIRQKARNE